MQAETPGLDFMIQPKEYILLNSTDEEIIMEHHGETRRIPPRNKVVRANPKYSDVPKSMQDPQGRYIPGTLVVSDIVASNEMGGNSVVWSAAEAIKIRLGIDTNTGTYTSIMALRGLSVVPPDASIELIRKIDADGIKRWKKFRIRQAAALIAAYDARNEKRKAHDLPAIAPDEKYLRAEAALAHLRSEEAKRLKDEFTKIVQVELAPESDHAMYEDPEAGMSTLDVPDDNTPEPEPAVVPPLTVDQLPKPRTIDTLSAMEKLQLLEEDPKAVKALKAKYNIRKRAYAKRKVGEKKKEEAVNV